MREGLYGSDGCHGRISRACTSVKEHGSRQETWVITCGSQRTVLPEQDAGRAGEAGQEAEWDGVEAGKPRQEPGPEARGGLPE